MVQVERRNNAEQSNLDYRTNAYGVHTHTKHTLHTIVKQIPHFTFHIVKEIKAETMVSI